MLQISRMTHYFLIALSLLLSFPFSLQDENSRNFFAVMREGYTLHYPTASFQTLKVDDLMCCALKCLEISLCFYFNYQVSSSGGLSYCQVFKGLYHTRRSQLDGLVQKTAGFEFGMVISKGPNSCLDYLRMNASGKNGIYEVRDTKTFQGYDVFCDFTSEPGSAWTLVLSYRRDFFKSGADEIYYQKDAPLNEPNPTFNGFRLSRRKMESLRWVSTHWRITCDFQVPGIELYRDYVRAKFADFDMINYQGAGKCMKMEYFNLRGYNCTNCMTPWWQDHNILHIDCSIESTWKACGHKSLITGTKSNEDSFGHYRTINVNHRCAEASHSTTNSWMGGYL